MYYTDRSSDYVMISVATGSAGQVHLLMDEYPSMYYRTKPTPGIHHYAHLNKICLRNKTVKVSNCSLSLTT